jgi:hypothetical protein
MCTSPLSNEDVQELIQKIYNEQDVGWPERRLAAFCLAYVDYNSPALDSAKKALVSVTHDWPPYELWRVRHSAKMKSCIPAISVILSVMVLGLSFYFSSGSIELVPVIAFILGLLLSIALSLAFIVGVWMTLPTIAEQEDNVRAAALWSLGRIGGVWEVPIVARLASDLRNRSSFDARLSLFRLLPLVTEENITYLDASTPKCLALNLAGADSSEACELLRVLGLIGGTAERTNVLKWSNKHSFPQAAKIAQEALVKIDERIHQAKNASSLLRPSSNTDADNLLRPVSSIAPNPDQLLRASDHQS